MSLSKANIMAISIEYRLTPDSGAPSSPLPIAYEDSWAGLQPTLKEPWLNDHIDLGRVILGGEIAGANIAHFTGVRAGTIGLEAAGLKIQALLIVHPFSGAKEPDEMYKFICPSSTGCVDDDPKLNPEVDSNLEENGG
ncbi:hypothetical protein Q3G72_003461 [Acer saccharum]|nr:hypothetical protein Q3G72_003461 [Acer saccharum]